MLMFFKLFFNSEKYPSSQAGLEHNNLQIAGETL